jgi:hypothetical protein
MVKTRLTERDKASGPRELYLVHVNKRVLKYCRVYICVRVCVRACMRACVSVLLLYYYYYYYYHYHHHHHHHHHHHDHYCCTATITTITASIAITIANYYCERSSPSSSPIIAHHYHRYPYPPHPRHFVSLIATINCQPDDTCDTCKRRGQSCGGVARAKSVFLCLGFVASPLPLPLPSPLPRRHCLHEASQVVNLLLRRRTDSFQMAIDYIYVCVCVRVCARARVRVHIHMHVYLYEYDITMANFNESRRCECPATTA